MGEHRELDETEFVRNEYMEEMVPVCVRMEETRMMLDDLKRQVRKLEDMLRRDELRFIKGTEDALRAHARDKTRALLN